MAPTEPPALSHYVNDGGAYVLSISAVPDEHLHRPLVIYVGDDTVADETRPSLQAWLLHMARIRGRRRARPVTAPTSLP